MAPNKFFSGNQIQMALLVLKVGDPWARLVLASSLAHNALRRKFQQNYKNNYGTMSAIMMLQ